MAHIILAGEPPYKKPSKIQDGRAKTGMDIGFYMGISTTRGPFCESGHIEDCSILGPNWRPLVYGHPHVGVSKSRSQGHLL